LIGTPSYVSPEVLAGHYNYKCDIWAIGVITYMLLSGEPPFYGKDERATLQSVRYGKWKFPEESFKDISAEAKHFIRICLSLSLSSRPTAAVAMTHKWFKTLILE
jgi:calcium-dependent protein kinase